VTPINITTRKAGKPITFGKVAEDGNAYIAITPNGKTVYVAESGPYRHWDTVTPISTATNKAGKAIKVGEWPVAVAITPNGKTVYVASTGSGPGGCTQPAHCGPAPAAAYAAGSGPATVTPISTATNKAGKAIKLGPTASSVSVAITPNSKTAYVLYDYYVAATQTSHGYVIPVRTATSTALKAIKAGSGLSNIAFTPNGKTAYVTRDRYTSQGQALRGYVIPVSTATNKAGTAIKVGRDPGAIAITP
jgi:DNA-binding beta-propeller fold protein YncE